MLLYIILNCISFFRFILYLGNRICIGKVDKSYLTVTSLTYDRGIMAYVTYIFMCIYIYYTV